MMKILELSPYVYTEGISGLQRNQTGFGIMVWNICRGLAEAGHDVSLFTYAPGKGEEFKGVNVLENFWYDNILSMLQSDPIRSLKEILPLNYSFSKKAKMLRHLGHFSMLEKVIKQQKPDVIHIHGITISSLPFLKTTMDTQIPFVVTLHGSMFSDPDVCEQELVRIKLLFELVAEKASLITCVSSGTRRDLLHQVKSLDPGKAVCIPNGIDLSLFKPNEKINREKRIFSVGSLSKRKNQIFLLESLLALRSCSGREIECIIAGEGPERENLEKFIEMHGMGNVKLIGKCSQEEIRDLYSSSWLTALVSTSEGFGLPIIESYACGTPVITFSDLDAVEDTYHEDAMVTVNGRDQGLFSKAIICAIGKEWNYRKIAEIARDWSIEKKADMYLEHFSKIINEEPRL